MSTLELKPIFTAPGTVVDVAGTAAITPLPVGEKYTAGGVQILAVGDTVAAHTSGANTHPPNTISTGSATVTAGGRPIAVTGSVAGCAGPVTTTTVTKYLSTEI